jgi:putative serine protease PepD
LQGRFGAPHEAAPAAGEEGEMMHPTGPETTIARRRLRPLAALAGLPVAALVLAGCGSTGTASTAAGSTSDISGSEALQQQFVQVVKQVGPSVVLVQTGQGLGSGIVFDAQGDIVTNNHVVTGASGFQVVLANGKRYPARLVGAYAPDDLAVLRINALGLAPAAFADSKALSVGDLALAIGNPLGLQSSVTEGIVSALGRTVNEDTGVALPNVIQTSAAINPGNSGGALVNLLGQVIGIPTLAATDPQLGGGSAPGIGFAIPSNIVRNIAIQLIQSGTVTSSNRGSLGVQVGTTTSNAVLVSQVQAGGPAAEAGIRVGDLITSVNGTATPDPTTLTDVLAALKPGRVVIVTVTHADGVRQAAQVTLGQTPA